MSVSIDPFLLCVVCCVLCVVCCVLCVVWVVCQSYVCVLVCEGVIFVVWFPTFFCCLCGGRSICFGDGRYVVWQNPHCNIDTQRSHTNRRSNIWHTFTFMHLTPLIHRYITISHTLSKNNISHTHKYDTHPRMHTHLMTHPTSTQHIYHLQNISNVHHTNNKKKVGNHTTNITPSHTSTHT